MTREKENLDSEAFFFFLEQKALGQMNWVTGHQAILVMFQQGNNWH